MPKPFTASTQDYLKHIYEITGDGGSASTTALAARLNLKAGSVTGMIQKLARADPPLLEYHKHRGATLTRAGKKAALEVIRHHRLLEAWLVQTLGYSWDEVHPEAERLEHAISEDFERRIARAMNHPARDPHGELIPTADLKMPPDDSSPLSALRPGQTATIQCVKDANPGLLRHLEELGLVPGTRIEVQEHSPFDHNLTIKLRRKSTVLGLNITSRIFVIEG